MGFINNLIDKMFLEEVNPEAFAPRVFEVAGLPIKSTVITTWVIIAILGVFAWLSTRNLKEKPKPLSLQNFAEFIVESIQGLVESAMGSGNQKYVPYIGTLIMFLALANLIGIVPGRDLFSLYTPTADLNTTFALALITFIAVHVSGIRAKGIGGYIKDYFEPMAFLFPLNIIGAIADPVSLSFRLFGNMLGGVVIMGLLYSVVGVLIPGIASLYFDVFAGVLQAFIFTMLTMTYIATGME
ncbi:ATP synthase F0 subunit A [Orenia metallireducens]|jgi:F-type H+-transporting ATPase subunit a|uniref:ATP synthase subunit a n=1 Tax=Orenia metallireducens TaxID=1413210 RepID=A0A1C0A676_9FIRM|nr:F0F1 ATP synthase subunit A [Orenia metallireducens]OCL25651.1 ATP synthase F0 subunit A [Orenia metallireducens]